MLFNSYIFICAFLPLTLFLYFSLGKLFRSPSTSHFILFLCSLTFYAWWKPENLWIILTSIVITYSAGKAMAKRRDTESASLWRKGVFLLALGYNIGLLFFFKYVGFTAENINALLGTSLPVLTYELPLGISFFTFQQIAYLIDSYYRLTKEYNFVNYGLFVTFFPQLIAGPIVHHKEIMEQFAEGKNRFLCMSNLTKGIYIFCIGLFKKVVIADNLSVFVNKGYALAHQLGFFEAWFTSLSYSFQLYFDFSAYSDMAIGLGWMFNIQITQNFNSPYKALNIQDFWRRWHITLSRFWRDYLYVPLGGSRKGLLTTCRNLLIVFLVGGLWHGASWTFVIWGALHGMALIAYQFWKGSPLSMPPFLGRIFTFLFCNFAWVFFRAETYGEALGIFKGMAGMQGIQLPSFLEPYLNASFLTFQGLTPHLQGGGMQTFLWLVFAALLVWTQKNAIEKGNCFRATRFSLALGVSLFLCSFFFLGRIHEFLYFNF